MEHPEKKLFDEIKQLKNNIEDLKFRVLKVESTYKHKVEQVEQREQQSIRSKIKLDALFSQSNTYISLFNNTKEYRLTATTLTNNIFKSKFLEELNSGKKRLNLDIDSTYFDILIRIIQLGHQVYSTQDQENLLNNILPNPNYRKNTDFIEFLRGNFGKKDFRRLSTMLSLNIKIMNENPKTCFSEFQVIGSSYENSNLVACKASSIEDILNLSPDSQKAIFINKDSIILIRLNEPVRTNGLYIRPFTMNKSFFNPTNGYNGSVSILVSYNDVDWECKAKVPQYDTLSHLLKLVEIKFKEYTTFKYIKFVSTTTQFSLAYIDLIR